MKLRKGRFIMITLLTVLMAFGVAGCHRERVESGGVTDKTDPNAPKEIKSKDITEFSVNFYHETRKNIDDEQFFNFEVKKSDQGVLMAVENKTGISGEADEDLLKSLQEVIDRYHLVAMNGYYRVTAGLPPECQKSTLLVLYESGEKLTFTANNNPSARWTAAIYDVFAKWFASKGNDSLYPKREDTPVTRMDIHIVENNIVRRFETMYVKEENAIDGDNHLLTKLIWDDEKKETIERKYIRIPEDYYDNITAILKKYDFDLKYGYSYFEHHNGFYGFNELYDLDEQDTDDFVDLYIEFESGERMSLETKKASEIAAMKDLLNDLIAYNDPLFE